MGQLGHRLSDHVPRILDTLVWLLRRIFAEPDPAAAAAAAAVAGEDDDENDGDEAGEGRDEADADAMDAGGGVAAGAGAGVGGGAAPGRRAGQRLRALALRRATEVVARLGDRGDVSSFPARLLAAVAGRVRRLPEENTQSPAGLLEALREIAASERLAGALLGGRGADGRYVRPVFAVIAAPPAAAAVRKAALDFAEALLDREAPATAPPADGAAAAAPAARGGCGRLAAHVPFLLRQLAARIARTVEAGGVAAAGGPAAQATEAALLRQQFGILSRISDCECDAEQVNLLYIILYML